MLIKTGVIMTTNLVRLSKAVPGSLLFAKATFYKWHHCKKFPNLFVKIGGALFVDLNKLREIIEAGRGTS
jgi:hypothetical protein